MSQLPQSSSFQFYEQFSNEQSELLNTSSKHISSTLLQSQLRVKIEHYKQLHQFKEKLIERIKMLRSRARDLENHGKGLSDSQKRKHPVFVVRPSFVAQRFITKEIKSSILELGKKFNSLNDYQKKEWAIYLSRHKENSQLIKQYYKLFVNKWKTTKEFTKKIIEQRYKAQEKKLQVSELQKFNCKLSSQIQYLIEAKKQDKHSYDTLSQNIQVIQKNTAEAKTLLSGEQSKYLKDFNVAVCRERIHSQLGYELKERKIAEILEESCFDREKQQRKQSILKSILRSRGVPMMFGKVVSYKKRELRSISVNSKTVNRHQKRITAKTEHTQSTALKTKQSFLF